MKYKRYVPRANIENYRTRSHDSCKLELLIWPIIQFNNGESGTEGNDIQL